MQTDQPVLYLYFIYSVVIVWLNLLVLIYGFALVKQLVVTKFFMVLLVPDLVSMNFDSELV